MSAINASDFQEALECYFFEGYQYSVIIRFLEKYHGISISLSTLKRKLRDLNLTRRRNPSSLLEVWNAVHQELNGPGKLSLLKAEFIGCNDLKYVQLYIGVILSIKQLGFFDA
jgi:hypothetical protein